MALFESTALSRDLFYLLVESLFISSPLLVLLSLSSSRPVNENLGSFLADLTGSRSKFN